MKVDETINKLEQLKHYADKNGVVEIVMRGKNKKFKEFDNVLIDLVGQKQEQKEAIQKAVDQFAKKHKIDIKNAKVLNNITKLDQMNLLLNGLNLCATCVGFVIVCHKIDGMSDQITEILSTIKTTNDLQIDFEFKKCVSEHTSMLDHRKTQDYFSLDRMENLVSREYDVLESMIKYFMSDVTSDKGVLLCSIMTMASMLSASLQFYDEEYYSQYKDTVSSNQIWHTSHDKWLSVFEKLASGPFVERVQDYGFLNLELSVTGCDAFYENIIQNSKDLKQSVVDNQELLSILNSKENMEKYNDLLNQEVAETIQTELFNSDEVVMNDELKETMNDAMQKVGIVH